MEKQKLFHEVVLQYISYCKNASLFGVTASEWIQRHAPECIIILLQSKRYTIAEIADKMEFSSRSFFYEEYEEIAGSYAT